MLKRTLSRIESFRRALIAQVVFLGSTFRYVPALVQRLKQVLGTGIPKIGKATVREHFNRVRGDNPDRAIYFGYKSSLRQPGNFPELGRTVPEYRNDCIRDMTVS